MEKLSNTEAELKKALLIKKGVLLDCLMQTYQIFRTAIFQEVSEDLTLSYDLISLFPLI